jgi:CRISPR-associated protein Csm4
MLRYILRPRGAFHFGERGIGVEETADLLHSDTLFAAIVSAWRLLGEPLTAENDLALLHPFHAGKPPLVLSSALPFAGDIPLFPRPHVPLGAEKSFKQVLYVSPQALALLAQGTRLTRERAEQELIQGGAVWMLPEERDRIVPLLLADEPDTQRRAHLQEIVTREPARITLWWGSDTPPVPHVVVDRVNAQPSLYHSGRLRFAQDCGLTFWAAIHDDRYQERLEAALTFLQDEGLGGKRTSGHGQFDWEVRDADLPAAADPTGYLTLSLYHPQPAELAAGVLDQAWYRRIHRRGWIFSPEGRNLRRKGLWMLREGAVLRTLPSSSPGDLSDLRPERGFPHPIWRYGYALTLPIRLEGTP